MAASSAVGTLDSAPPRRNFSINSIASTYSEFAVIHSFSNIYQSLGAHSWGREGISPGAPRLLVRIDLWRLRILS